MNRMIVCCMYFICGYIHAQESAQADTTRMLGEVVISVNRWEQKLSEIPSRVTKVGASLIQFQNPQTAADLLGASNQVFIQKSQMGGGSPMIRGFATNRVLLVVDGVRMNNAIFRSGNVQNVISLDANSIENAEIIFGPGSVVYGSDAIGGVMDFHTFSAKLSTDKKPLISANSMVRYASANNENTGHVDINIGLQKWAFLTSVTVSEYGDLKQGSHGPDEYLQPDFVVRESGVDVIKVNGDPRVQLPSGYSQFNGMQKIRFRPSSNWDLRYAFHYSRTSSYDRYDRLIAKNPNGNFSSADWRYGPQKWVMYSLQINYLKSSPLFDVARVTAAYQDYKESRHNRNFGSANRNNRFENVKAFSVNADLDKTLNDKIHLFYGTEVVINKVFSSAYRLNISDETVTALATRYPDNSDWQAYAAYISSKIKLSEPLLVTVSGRLSHIYTHARFDNQFFNFPFTTATLRNTAINGSVGIIYNPSENWKVYSTISSGFRAPNVDDIGKVFDSAPGNVVVPNSDLAPEKAYSAEVGAAGVIGKKLKVDFGAYYTTMNNAIARAPSLFNGQDSIDYDGVLSRVLSLQNINELVVYGIQVGVDWRLTKSLRITSSVNFQKGKEKDFVTGLNSPPTHVAPLFGSTHLIFTVQRVTADIYSNYAGEIAFQNLSFSEQGDQHLYAKDVNGNPHAPSWGTLNVKTSTRISKVFKIDVGIENIFDKRYRPYSSGISAAGRNFTIGVRSNF